MNWKFLYTDLDGRINRKPFWLASVVILIAGLILSFCLPLLLGINRIYTTRELVSGTISPDEALSISRIVGWCDLATTLILLLPMIALVLKRRHDRNKSGIEVWVYFCISILIVLAQALGIGYSVEEVFSQPHVTPNIVLSFASYAELFLAIYLLVVTGFLKGNPDANSYGPNPLASE